MLRKAIRRWLGLGDPFFEQATRNDLIEISEEVAALKDVLLTQADSAEAFAIALGQRRRFRLAVDQLQAGQSLQWPLAQDRDGAAR